MTDAERFTQQQVVVSRREWDASQARIARLESALEALAAVTPRIGHQSVLPDVPDLDASGLSPAMETIRSRRQMLTGLAGAAVGAAAVGLASAEPAAAANGDGLILGNSDNSATAPTGLSVNGSNDAYGFAVTDNGFESEIIGKPAILATSGGGNFNTAVTAIGENGVRGAYITGGGGGVPGTVADLYPALEVSGGGTSGLFTVAAVEVDGNVHGVQAKAGNAAFVALVEGASSGLIVRTDGSAPTSPGIKVSVKELGANPTNPALGIQVDSASGVGVQATSIAGYGVYGKSTSSYGTAGRSEASYGVVGVAKTGAAGVYGVSEDNTGSGVYGKSDSANGIASHVVVEVRV